MRAEEPWDTFLPDPTTVLEEGQSRWRDRMSGRERWEIFPSYFGVCREFQTHAHFYYRHPELKLSLSSSSSPSSLLEKWTEKRDDDDIESAESLSFLDSRFSSRNDRRFWFECMSHWHQVSLVLFSCELSLCVTPSSSLFSCLLTSFSFFTWWWRHKTGRARVRKSCHLQTRKTREGGIKRTRNLLHHPMHRYILQGWPENCLLWCPSSGYESSSLDSLWYSRSESVSQRLTTFTHSSFLLFREKTSL